MISSNDISKLFRVLSTRYYMYKSSPWPNRSLYVKCLFKFSIQKQYLLHVRFYDEIIEKIGFEYTFFYDFITVVNLLVLFFYTVVMLLLIHRKW